MTAKELVAQLTLEEKAALCSGQDFWHLKTVERLGLGPIMVTDGPHGLRKQAEGGDHLGLAASVPATCFPTASATACSFDRQLLRDIGHAMGEECLAEEVAVILGPGANLKRSPLCGRNFEYISEDPYLTGELAAALISGVEETGVGTSLKHFAANNQEARRMSIDVVADERALREVYLTGFEKAVQQGKPSTVMCSYNKIDGVYSSDNRWLLTDVLRDEWGFEGLVMTDWFAMNDRVKAIEAGLDLEMPASGGINDAKIVAAVQAGQLSEEAVDACAARVVALIQKGMQAKAAKKPYDKNAHHALARRAAAESCVLLKNDGGALPLQAGANIAVIGKFAREPRYQGAGSSKINPSRMDNAHDELAALGFRVTYADGYKGVYTNEPLVAEACGVAKGKDAVVIFAGLPAEFESEGFDRTRLDMPDSHTYLIEKVAAANPNTIVVLQLGAPVATPFAGKVKAVVAAYLGGQAGGGGIADVLSGKVNPCGKLAESWPARLADVPCCNYFPGGEKTVEYRESLFVGYRYYEAAGKPVPWAFGHGKSYTTFEYSGLAVSAPEFTGVEDVAVYCTVKNTGPVAGAEVVQLYAGLPKGKVMRPMKELKDFDKVYLEPGESKVVSFRLNRRTFAYYNPAAHMWCVEGGTYNLHVAAASNDVRLSATIRVAGDGKETLLAVQLADCPEYFNLPAATGGVNASLVIPDHSFAALYGKALPPPKRDPGAPFDETSTIADLQSTLVGKQLKRMVAKQAKGMMPSTGEDADDLNVMLDAMMLDMPLRSLSAMSGGALSPARLQGILDMANGHFFAGLGKLVSGGAGRDK